MSAVDSCAAVPSPRPARSLHLRRYGTVVSDRPPDRITRCLSAAVHFDARFATRLYDEFLAEPCRAVPPSPGLDSAVVLREAAAAMARRRVRDLVSLALLVLGLVVSPVLMLSWLLIGVVWVFVRAGRSPLSKLTGSLPRRNRWKTIAIVLIVLTVLPLVAAVVISLLELGASERGVIPEAGAVLGSSDLFAVMIVITLYVVFAADRLIEWSLAVGSFREGRFVAHPLFDAWQGEQLARTVTTPYLQERLKKIAEGGESGNVIVYRGSDPFVGAGEPLQCWSMAIPLRPKDAPLVGLSPAQISLGSVDAVAPGYRFTPKEMHEYVRQQFDGLRSSLSLSPSGRLQKLTQESVLIASAEDLLAHQAEHPTALAVLPDFGISPKFSVPDELVDELADEPVEWMRHFTRFQVESWERDLVVSGFLHLGCDNRMLYVEWNALVLYPPRARFGAVDLVPDSPWPALRRAFGDLLACPAAVPLRLRQLRRPTPRDDKLSVYSSLRYGSRTSIRELAAGTKAGNYFQDTDIQRYRKIMEQHVVASIMAFLASKKLSTAEFAEKAATIINNSGNMLLNTGSITGTAAGGDVTVTGAAVPPDQQSKLGDGGRS